MFAGNGLARETPDNRVFVQVLWYDVPGQFPLTVPCSTWLLPVMYPTQYVVLALNVGQLLMLTEFQPDDGVMVPVETEQRSELGVPEELL